MKNFKFNLSMRNHFFVDRVLSLFFALTTGLMAVPFVNAKAVVSEDAVILSSKIEIRFVREG